MIRITSCLYLYIYEFGMNTLLQIYNVIKFNQLKSKVETFCRSFGRVTADRKKPGIKIKIRRHLLAIVYKAKRKKRYSFIRKNK